MNAFNPMSGRKKLRGKDKKATRLPVDSSRLNMGNTYDSPPLYYYDIEFACRDCGSVEIWKAAQQKWWYEEAGGYFFATAVRCRSCREQERRRKQQAREARHCGLAGKTGGTGSRQ